MTLRRMQWAYIGIALAGLLPVSYTHLDVYKRQGSRFASRSARSASLRAAQSWQALPGLDCCSCGLPVSYTHLDVYKRQHDGNADRSQIALLNGKPVVGFSLARSRGADELKVRDAVRAALADLAKQHPGVSFRQVTDMSEETQRSYSSSMTMLWEGALLALAVVFWFLRDWRATWVSAIALPLSIIPTFAAIAWLGFSLNMITLLALSVVIGLLVCLLYTSRCV